MGSRKADMTALDEAIAHCDALSTPQPCPKHDAARDECVTETSRMNCYPDADYCTRPDAVKCANEHAQLARWLRELRDRRVRDSQ